VCSDDERNWGNGIHFKCGHKRK